MRFLSAPVSQLVEFSASNSVQFQGVAFTETKGTHTAITAHARKQAGISLGHGSMEDSLVDLSLSTLQLKASVQSWAKSWAKCEKPRSRAVSGKRLSQAACLDQKDRMYHLRLSYVALTRDPLSQPIHNFHNLSFPVVWCVSEQMQ